MRRRSQGRSRSRAGFTLIEVMVSLGIMTIGAMAIIALQQHAIRANSHARQLSTAMLIAQRWVERLKQDAHTWNDVGTPTTLATVLGNTQYLNAIVANPNIYQAPPNVTATVSEAFDYLGNDVGDNTAAVEFCASIRPAWVYFGRTMRVDVRVFWRRAGANGDAGGITGDFRNCANNLTALDPGGTQFNNYHVVYLPAVIRMVPVVR